MVHQVSGISSTNGHLPDKAMAKTGGNHVSEEEEGTETKLSSNDECTVAKNKLDVRVCSETK